jgi:nicotinamidase-related amidase
VVSAARTQGLKIFCVPPDRWEPGDYVSFDFPSPYQLGTAKAEVFANGSWGGTFHDDFQPQPGDVIVHEHWGSSGFANTDLDLQRPDTWCRLIPQQTKQAPGRTEIRSYCL